MHVYKHMQGYFHCSKILQKTVSRKNVSLKTVKEVSLRLNAYYTCYMTIFDINHKYIKQPSSIINQTGIAYHSRLVFRRHPIWIISAILLMLFTSHTCKNLIHFHHTLVKAQLFFNTVSITVNSHHLLLNNSTYVVCSKSIRIGIVVVVHWVGCVCNQSWHVRTCLSNSWHKLQEACVCSVGCSRLRK